MIRIHLNSGKSIGATDFLLSLVILSFCSSYSKEAAKIVTTPTITKPVGLIRTDARSLNDGYVLFAPIGSRTNYLIDICGEQLKTWSSNYKPSRNSYIFT